MGETTAKLLASKGATVALAARRVDKLQRVAAEIKFAVRAISEGLWHEVGGNIRTTVISPGAIMELKFGSGHDDSRNFVVDFYKMAIPADAIAQAIAYAIEQPGSVDVNEIVIRPTVQDFRSVALRWLSAGGPEGF